MEKLLRDFLRDTSVKEAPLGMIGAAFFAA